MSSALLSFLLAMQAAGAPQLADIEGLSTEKAGDLILAGREHRPIVAIGEQKTFGPPGLVELKLAESPVREGSGCRRRMWTASFFLSVDGRPGTAGLQTPYATNEVALATNRPCELASYSGLSPDVTAARGIELLSLLRSFSAEAAEVRFRCSDATGSGLCGDAGRMKAALRDLRAWHVAERDGEAKMWLGEPGQVVTEVRFASGDPYSVTIERLIPAPA